LCRLKENVWLACYGGEIVLGEEVFVGRNAVVQGHGGVIIGAFSSIGPNVVIVSHREVMAGPQRLHAQGFVPATVRIGADCHIGAGTTVLGGVEIAPRTMVGANSVVTRSLDGDATYVGAPARRVGPFERPDGPLWPVMQHSDWDR
jgi:acetyltransferase-like isoleucine patch superfamily enzyme